MRPLAAALFSILALIHIPATLRAQNPSAITNDAFAAALKRSGSTRVTTQHIATDHAYSDRRIALETAILAWLAKLQ